jgi:hypothetical protein
MNAHALYASDLKYIKGKKEHFHYRYTHRNKCLRPISIKRNDDLYTSVDENIFKNIFLSTILLDMSQGTHQPCIGSVCTAYCSSQTGFLVTVNRMRLMEEYV